MRGFGVAEKLKISKQDIEDLVLNLDKFKHSFELYRSWCQNMVTALWIGYFLLFALIGLLVPQIENMLLIGLVGGVFALIKIIPPLSQKLINLYLKNINKDMGREVEVYQRYHQIIKKHMVETLKEGSESNFLQKVVIKTLARTY